MTAQESPSSQTEILLISCYELGHQPMGLASPMAFLARAGLGVATVDVSVDPWESLDEDRVRRARLVAISVPMHTALRLGTRVARRVRILSPSSHICFYGLYASLNADYLLANGADSVLGGEYEQSLVTLAQTLGDDVGGMTLPHSAPVMERLAFPVPQRGGLPPLERYAHLDRNGHFGLVGYIEASRGCLHLCRHCPIPPVYKGRFFVVPKEVVLADIRQLVDAGATPITVGDPDFLNGPGHSMAIAQALHSLYPQLTFDFTAKVEHLLKYRSLLPELGRLGCIFVVSALESLSNEVLRELDKGHTREDAIEAVHLLRQAGISPRPTWVAFTPWTRLRDYIDVLDWIEEEDLVDHVDPVQFTVRLLVPPGSDLLGRASIQPFLGALVPESFTHPWTHPDPRMDELHARVSTLVERASETGEDPVVTFARIRDLVGSMGEAPTSIFRRPAPADRVRAPRLTEPWFC
jgi:radical SAM superfamily enzyme YgiQ (UPF0313 family)